MALKYWEEIEDISEDMYFETEDRYYKVMFSDLSLLQMIISLGNKDIDINNIKSRSNNIFYSNCIYHNAVDYPVRINEKSKTCTCFGCGKNFSIITLVKDYYSIGYKDALDILYAYLYNDLDILNKKQLEVYKELVELYNKDENRLLKEKCLEENKQKTKCLENRIITYVEKYKDSPNLDERTSKRLSCDKKHVKKIIQKLNINNSDNELPFK